MPHKCNYCGTVYRDAVPYGQCDCEHPDVHYFEENRPKGTQDPDNPKKSESSWVAVIVIAIVLVVLLTTFE